jgi:hypothetical protein
MFAIQDYLTDALYLALVVAGGLGVYNLLSYLGFYNG